MQPYKKEIFVGNMGKCEGYLCLDECFGVLLRCCFLSAYATWKKKCSHAVGKFYGYLFLDECPGVLLTWFTVFLMMLSLIEVCALTARNMKKFSSNFNKCVWCSLPGTAFLKFSVTFKVSNRAANSFLWHKVHRVTCATWVYAQTITENLLKTLHYP